MLILRQKSFSFCTLRLKTQQPVLPQYTIAVVFDNYLTLYNTFFFLLLTIEITFSKVHAIQVVSKLSFELRHPLHLICFSYKQQKTKKKTNAKLSSEIQNLCIQKEIKAVWKDSLSISWPFQKTSTLQDRMSKCLILLIKYRAIVKSPWEFYLQHYAIRVHQLNQKGAALLKVS